jgi:hypothetical protein
MLLLFLPSINPQIAKKYLTGNSRSLNHSAELLVKYFFLSALSILF